MNLIAIQNCVWYCLWCVDGINYTVMPLCLSSAKDKGEKKLFGFSFTPLMREDGTTLSDESHELYVYKVGSHRHAPMFAYSSYSTLFCHFYLTHVYVVPLFPSVMRMRHSVTRACTWACPAVRRTSTAASTCPLPCPSRGTPRRPSGSPHSFAPPSSPRTVQPTHYTASHHTHTAL